MVLEIGACVGPAYAIPVADRAENATAALVNVQTDAESRSSGSTLLPTVDLQGELTVFPAEQAPHVHSATAPRQWKKYAAMR